MMNGTSIKTFEHVHQFLNGLGTMEFHIPWWRVSWVIDWAKGACRLAN